MPRQEPNSISQQKRDDNINIRRAAMQSDQGIPVAQLRQHRQPINRAASQQQRAKRQAAEQVDEVLEDTNFQSEEQAKQAMQELPGGVRDLVKFQPENVSEQREKRKKQVDDQIQQNLQRIEGRKERLQRELNSSNRNDSRVRQIEIRIEELEEQNRALKEGRKELDQGSNIPVSDIVSYARDRSRNLRDRIQAQDQRREQQQNIAQEVADGRGDITRVRYGSDGLPERVTADGQDIDVSSLSRQERDDIKLTSVDRANRREAAEKGIEGDATVGELKESGLEMSEIAEIGRLRVDRANRREAAERGIEGDATVGELKESGLEMSEIAEIGRLRNQRRANQQQRNQNIQFSPISSEQFLTSQMQRNRVQDQLRNIDLTPIQQQNLQQTQTQVPDNLNRIDFSTPTNEISGPDRAQRREIVRDSVGSDSILGSLQNTFNRNFDTAFRDTPRNLAESAEQREPGARKAIENIAAAGLSAPAGLRDFVIEPLMSPIQTTQDIASGGIGLATSSQARKDFSSQAGELGQTLQSGDPIVSGQLVGAVAGPQAAVSGASRVARTGAQSIRPDRTTVNPSRIDTRVSEDGNIVIPTARGSIDVESGLFRRKNQRFDTQAQGALQRVDDPNAIRLVDESRRGRIDPTTPPTTPEVFRGQIQRDITSRDGRVSRTENVPAELIRDGQRERLFIDGQELGINRRELDQAPQQIGVLGREQGITGFRPEPREGLQRGPATQIETLDPTTMQMQRAFVQRRQDPRDFMIQDSTQQRIVGQQPSRFEGMSISVPFTVETPGRRRQTTRARTTTAREVPAAPPPQTPQQLPEQVPGIPDQRIDPGIRVETPQRRAATPTDPFLDDPFSAGGQRQRTQQQMFQDSAQRELSPIETGTIQGARTDSPVPRTQRRSQDPFADDPFLDISFSLPRQAPRTSPRTRPVVGASFAQDPMQQSTQVPGQTQFPVQDPMQQSTQVPRMDQSQGQTQFPVQEPTAATDMRREQDISQVPRMDSPLRSTTPTPPRAPPTTPTPPRTPPRTPPTPRPPQRRSQRQSRSRDPIERELEELEGQFAGSVTGLFRGLETDEDIENLTGLEARPIRRGRGF